MLPTMVSSREKRLSGSLSALLGACRAVGISFFAWTLPAKVPSFLEGSVYTQRPVMSKIHQHDPSGVNVFTHNGPSAPVFTSGQLSGVNMEVGHDEGVLTVPQGYELQHPC